MEKTKKALRSPEKIKDVSRFTRWVNQLDEKDKILNPDKRTIKWVLTLAVLFLLFAFSFILFPSVKLDKGKIEAIQNTEEIGKEKQGGLSKTESFDLPVDSFENHLKQKIYEHENIPEKK